MVPPDNKSEKTDCDHRKHHRLVTKDWLATEDAQHITRHTHGRKDHDVDLRMPEKPEKMLPKQRLSALSRIKEARTEVQIKNEHGSSRGKNRNRQKKKECGDE